MEYIYIYSNGFGYCGKDNLILNIIVHPKWLVQLNQSEEKIKLLKCEHRQKVTEIVQEITGKILQNL